MRRKIVTGFIALSIIILAVGFYIIFRIEKTSAQLKDLLASHQVEIIRRNLSERLKRVQFDFYLINTRYARGINTIVSDVQEMQSFADQCLGCHHSERVRDKIHTIRNDIEIYKAMLSRVLTMRANLSRMQAEERRAYMQGQQLVETVESIISRASSGLAEKTQRSLMNMEKTKTLLFILLITGPFLFMALSMIMISNITKPLQVILDAIRMLKNGDLNFRIKTPLKDEFSELASAFNEMTHTLNEQMRKMQRTEQMAVCGQLAAGLAHEIKNPLAGIKAAVEVFSEELTLSRENQETLQKVISEIKRLESLMKSLLDFARPAKPQFVSVDLNSILESTIAFLLKQPSFSQKKTKGTEIVKDFGAHLPEVTADPQQLRQVFMNLLLNANEAMPDGGTVTVRTFLDPSGSIQISIADTGPGIREDFLDKVFQPFFTTKPKGTGLGLAISKQLIEQHRGVINVENNHNRGATFKIKIPVIQPERTERQETWPGSLSSMTMN